MLTRTAWVVKTPYGFLGRRRYEYAAGTTTAKADSSFKHARLFTREADARQSCERGDVVVDVTINAKERE